jgi:hypothetical protein
VKINFNIILSSTRRSSKGEVALSPSNCVHMCSKWTLLAQNLLYNGYRVFSGGKERPGRDAELSPLLVPWSRKSRAVPLLPLWTVRPVQSLSACTRVHFTLFTGTKFSNGKQQTWAV